MASTSTLEEFEPIHCRGPVSSAYSPAQITHYLKQICFPASLLSGPRDITFLRILHVLQIATVPCENLSLHYNASHANSIDLQEIYVKFVTDDRGRGGYCIETVLFWREILRGLGFRAYASMARIRLQYNDQPQGPFLGYRHGTNIVLLDDGTKWTTDVGLEGDGPSLPLPIISTSRTGPENNSDNVSSLPIARNLGSQQVRLFHGPMPDSTDPDNNLVYIYQYRSSTQSEWNSVYAFSLDEAFEADFLQPNYWVSRADDSFQRHKVIVVKFILSGKAGRIMADPDNARTIMESRASLVEEGTGGNGLIAGKVMMVQGVVERNLGGRTTIVQQCKTEQERFHALEEWFNITLTEDEVTGIKGYETELHE